MLSVKAVSGRFCSGRLALAKHGVFSLPDSARYSSFKLVIEKLPNPPLSDQSRDTDGCAPATLDIAARLGCDRVAGWQPQGARLDRGRLPGRCPRTSLRHEGVMQGNVVHFSSPDQQGIRGSDGRTRRTEGTATGAPARTVSSDMTRRQKGRGSILRT